MSYADTYIRRATRGLFGKTRLERAAELRAHLLERQQQFVQDGFSAEEAEYLAVEHMGGLPQPLRIRRALTAAVLGLALAGYAYLQEGYPLYSLDYPSLALAAQNGDDLYESDDLSTSVTTVFGTQSLSVRLPEAAEAVAVQVVKQGEASKTLRLPVTYERTGLFHRAKLLDAEYRLDRRSGAFEVSVWTSRAHETLRIGHPDESSGGFFLEPRAYFTKVTPESLPSLPLNRWTPVAILNAKSQTAEGTEASAIMYVLAHGATSEVSALGANGDLDEVLARHQDLKYGLALTIERSTDANVATPR